LHRVFFPEPLVFAMTFAYQPFLRATLSLLGWILLCFLPATLGALFMPGDWYASLQKPTWNPPGWVFGPVWSTLYLLMGISVWLVWMRGGFTAHRRPLSLFLVQLALNAAWTPLFFGLQRPDLALVEIMVLWGAILWTIREFWRINRWASALLWPYLLWVSFATILNATLWWMN
jgi:benzodiazapine receptor